MEQSFKERIAQVAIEQAKAYKAVYVDYEYLICSDVFTSQDYYIIACTPSNYKHLLGVNTSLSADDFFIKCVAGTLSAEDFDFIKPKQTEKMVKGTVRRKIRALPFFMNMMCKDMIVQERFEKNAIFCSFATTDAHITAGFVNEEKSRPMTLLQGDELDWTKAGLVELILRRKTGKNDFDEIVVGDMDILLQYYNRVEAKLSPELRQKAEAFREVDLLTV